MLDPTKAGNETRYLDIGCGSGLACHLAAGRGAAVSGIDSPPGLLTIAAERTSKADLRVVDMASLPWENDSFDAATFINSFFFAADQDLATRGPQLAFGAKEAP